jgi:hypothetical protein
MLSAGKTLFLSRGDNLTVADNRGGAVVLESRNAENEHFERIRKACK